MAVFERHLQQHLSDLKTIDRFMRAQADFDNLHEHAVQARVDAALRQLGLARLCVIGQLAKAQHDSMNSQREAKGFDVHTRRDIGISLKKLPHIYAARIFRDGTPWADLEETYRLALADDSTLTMQARKGVGQSTLLISGKPRVNFQGQTVVDQAVGNISLTGLFDLRSAYGKVV